MTTDTQDLLRLFQLVSPSFPTGAFSYSQGLEWAVECGWVKNRNTLVDWLGSVLRSGFQELEIPLVKRMYEAVCINDPATFVYWRNYLIASRETMELRLEEQNRGRAMASVLRSMGDESDDNWLERVQPSQAAGFAYAAVRWGIGCQEALVGYTWNWLENSVMAALKLLPLGQTAGQTVLNEMLDHCRKAVECGMICQDDAIGGSCPALAIASSLHETQYTRLFRS